MIEVTCDRCETTYRLDREKKYAGHDRRHCPRCGKRNEKPAREPDAIEEAGPPVERTVADGGDVRPEEIAEQIARTADGDVHVHFHQ